MAQCRFFSQYMASQRKAFLDALNENKWYLSERARRDVGIDAATVDFCKRHLDTFAHQFRTEYCRDVCPDREHCELARHIDSIRSTQESRAVVNRGSAGEDSRC